jgi:hypothetical protein
MIIITLAIIDLLFFSYMFLLNYDEIINDLPKLIYIDNEHKDEKTINEKKQRNREYYIKNRERIKSTRQQQKASDSSSCLHIASTVSPNLVLQ